MQTTFTPSHRFFDTTVTLVTGLALQNLGGALYGPRGSKPFGPNDEIFLAGKSHVTDVQYVLRPAPILDAIMKGGWPTQLAFDVQPLGSVPSTAAKLNGMRRFNSQQLAQSFMSFFEANVPDAKAKWPGDPYTWHPAWNFGRVVRNALVHRGEIIFDNPNARLVAWKTLQYSPADNGKMILFTDLAYAELLALMEEMDAAL